MAAVYAPDGSGMAVVSVPGANIPAWEIYVLRDGSDTPVNITNNSAIDKLGGWFTSTVDPAKTAVEAVSWGQLKFLMGR